jgi:hypothetical protein
MGQSTAAARRMTLVRPIISNLIDVARPGLANTLEMIGPHMYIPGAATLFSIFLRSSAQSVV